MLSNLKKTLLEREYSVLSEELDEMILLGEDDENLLDEEFEGLSEGKEYNFDDIPEDDPNLGDDDLDALLDEAKEEEMKPLGKEVKESDFDKELNEDMNFDALEYYGEFLEEAMNLEEAKKCDSPELEEGKCSKSPEVCESDEETESLDDLEELEGLEEAVDFEFYSALLEGLEEEPELEEGKCSKSPKMCESDEEPELEESKEESEESEEFLEGPMKKEETENLEESSFFMDFWG